MPAQKPLKSLSRKSKILIPNTRFKPGEPWNRWRGLLFVGVFAVIGVSLLLLTHAQDQFAVSCPTDPGVAIFGPYGQDRPGHLHAGIDISVNQRPVYAAESGQIIFAGADNGLHDGYQRTIDLRGASGRVYRYAHLGRIDVSQGQTVSAAQQMGESGNGDGAVAYHLHWEVRTDGGGAGFNGTIDPTWAYQHCGGGSPPPAGANTTTSINPTGTDCHTYTLQYDPSHFYPCVQHLQNDIHVTADGYFGPITKSAVQTIQAQHGLNQSGIVDPPTWCVIHTDLSGCSTPPAAPAPVASSQPDRTPLGNVDASTCNGSVPSIVGWAFDPDNANVSLGLHIYIDGQGPFGATANTSRPDVNNAFGIPGNHGFNWPVPAQFYNGAPHSFTVTAFGVNAAGTQNAQNSGLGGNRTFGPCASAPAPTTTTTSAGPITNVYSGLCLDTPGSNINEGVQLQMYTCNGSGAQAWSYGTNNSIQIYNPNTGTYKCLDIPGNSKQAGTRVQLYGCNGTDAQRWTRNSDQTIRSASGFCLDNFGWGTTDGTQVGIWYCPSGAAQQNQQWR